MDKVLSVRMNKYCFIPWEVYCIQFFSEMASVLDMHLSLKTESNIFILYRFDMRWFTVKVHCLFYHRLPKCCLQSVPSWWEFCCLVCEWMSVTSNKVHCPVKNIQQTSYLMIHLNGFSGTDANVCFTIKMTHCIKNSM